MVQKIGPTIKLRIRLGQGDYFNGKKTITIKPKNYNVGNSNSYDPKGQAKKKQSLCGIRTSIGDTTKVVKKTDTISEVIFHELCHALHKYSEREMNDPNLLDIIYRENERGKSLWSGKDAEEMYTITGHHCDGNTKVKRFDPISCNMFDICSNISNPEQIVQRVFHYDYKAYKKYLTKHGLSESEALYKIEEFLINVNEYTQKIPSAIADKI
jgi:hypothetical protein